MLVSMNTSYIKLFVSKMKKQILINLQRFFEIQTQSSFRMQLKMNIFFLCVPVFQSFKFYYSQAQSESTETIDLCDALRVD